MKFSGESKRDARPTGDERGAPCSLTDRDEIIVANGIDDDQCLPELAGLIKTARHGRGAGFDLSESDQADRRLGLERKPAANIRVGHWVKRMVLEPPNSLRRRSFTNRWP